MRGPSAILRDWQGGRAYEVLEGLGLDILQSRAASSREPAREAHGERGEDQEGAVELFSCMRVTLDDTLLVG